MVYFEKIRWCNLLSTGNTFTEIDFASTKTTLIVGENGAGKSTILDAFSFALYGKPFRKINKPQLVNSINKKGLLVEIEFTVSGRHYCVRRGIKPSIFEIIVDDTIINQHADSKDYQEVLETTILKMNHKSFSQIVVLGSASFTPFMQLTAQNRREIIEDLLDIQIFTTMNVLLRDKVQQNKERITEALYQIKNLSEKIDLQQQHEQTLQQATDDQIAVHQQNIETHKATIEQLSTQIEDLEQDVSDLLAQTANHTKLEDKKREHTTLSHQLKAKYKIASDTIKFFEQHQEDCPTCRQPISNEHRNHIVATNDSQMTVLAEALNKLDGKINQTKEKLTAIEEILKQVDYKRVQISNHRASIKATNGFIRSIETQIATLSVPQKRTNSSENISLKEIKEQLEQVKGQREQLERTRLTLGAASLLLKDGGIKTKIIKQYVPVMNKLINKYLASMDFYVNFELNENFEETIRSRFRDDFSYSSFSEGEKARLDLALVFTWRALSKMRNSASTNLLILDEVFDGSLDTSGNEELLKILQTVAPGNNIFVISHKTDAYLDKFDRVIKFVKHKNFSHIVDI